ncbi:MAG: putative quinol monooxygenase [Ilumatobacteraceae bacterium]
MSKVSVWVKLELQPGKRDEAVAIIQEALDAVQSEDGTELYLLHTDPSDENVLYFYEKYADNDSLTAHGTADWFKAFGPKLGPVLAGRPSMQFVTPVGGKGF